MSELTPGQDAPAVDTCGGDHLLAELTDEFLRRHRAGQRPSVDEYTSKYPDLASRILELFPVMLAMEQPGATLDAAPFTERVGATIGRYRLLERIGEGGFGVVYMAEQLAPVRRIVAVKVIKPGYDTRQVIARFEAERQALALMDHENIAKVFDAGASDSGRPYFVMELVHGVPITEYCDRNELPPRERLELFLQVCRAVQHAHTKGIIHRDIKPTNVLVTLHEGVAVPKVIDFGVAKATGQQLTDKTLFTNFAQMVGTPLYMSPEQAEMSSVDIDTRSDVYSLGVLLYELLTGTTPLDKDRIKRSAFDEIRRIIREEEPPRPSTRLSTLGDQAKTISARRKSDPAQLGRLVRGELDWIVMKALEKDRRQRYETANGLARDIERYLRDDPVEACPPSSIYRLKKFVRRNKGPVVAVAIVLLALTGGVIGTSVGLVRAEQARRAERQAKQEALAREAETKAVLEFVETRIFAAAKPEGFGGLGQDVSLRQAIEAALPFVEKSFTDRPLIEARLRMTVGTSFYRLGQPAIAAAQFEQARSLYTKHLGHDHPDTLTSIHFVAKSYSDLGRHEEAAKLDEEVVALRKVKLGHDHRDTLTSMASLAAEYEHLKRYTEALKLDEEVLTLRKATLGADDRDTLGSMNDLANSYEYLGRFSEALKLREEVLSLAKAKLGVENATTLLATGNLAGAYGHLGQRQEALKLYLQALALAKVRLGPDNPYTLAYMSHTAYWLGQCGRGNEAVQLIDECVRRAHENGHDAKLIHSSISVRLHYFQNLKDATGCRTSAEMWEMFKPTKAGDLYDAACWRAVTAGLFLAANSSREAIKNAATEADRAMDLLNKAVDAGYSNSDHMKQDKDLDALRDRADFKTLLAGLDAKRLPVDIAWGLTTNAEPSHRDPPKALALAQEAVTQTPQDAKSWKTLGAARYRSSDFNGAIVALQKSRELGIDEPSNDFFLSMAHWRAGHQEEARQCYNRGATVMERTPKTAIFTRLQLEAAEFLGDKVTTPAAALDEWNHQAWILRRDNKLEEARAMRRKVVDAAKALYPRGDPRRAKYQNDYIQILIQMQSYKEAETVANDALKSLPSGDTASRLLMLRSLVNLYEQWNKPEEAERYRMLVNSAEAVTRPAPVPAP